MHSFTIYLQKKVKESQKFLLTFAGAVLYYRQRSRKGKVKDRRKRRRPEQKGSERLGYIGYDRPVHPGGAGGGQRGSGAAAQRPGPAVWLCPQPDQLCDVHPFFSGARLHCGVAPGRRGLHPHHPGAGGPPHAADARHQLRGRYAGPGQPGPFCPTWFSPRPWTKPWDRPFCGPCPTIPSAPCQRRSGIPCGPTFSSRCSFTWFEFSIRRQSL